jgi:uncharacterized protein
MGDKSGIKEYRLALRENRLLGLKCGACGFVTAPPRLVCRHCGGSDLAVVPLSGKGKIVTFTSIYVPPENRRGQAPYLVVVVELEEGPWIMGNIQGADPANATLDLIGKAVYMNNDLIPNDRKPPEDIAPMFVVVQ